jgi:hypothetical protein
MAILHGNPSNVNGRLTVTGVIKQQGEDISPWHYMSHCANGTDTTPNYAGGRLHVRTPIRADNSHIGWNPIIMEVRGYHTYSGEATHNFKAVLNTNGYNNDWYGSQIKADSGYNSLPLVYKSTNTYGGYHRVCFSVTKIGCCCTGHIWVRFWNNTVSAPYDYAWATEGRGDSQGTLSAPF